MQRYPDAVQLRHFVRVVKEMDSKSIGLRGSNPLGVALHELEYLGAFGLGKVALD